MPDCFQQRASEVLMSEVPRPEFPPQVPIAVKHSKHAKHSKHVGHVGALAIAPVGGAIASAGVAWADDSSDTAAGRSNDSRISAHATFLSTKMVRHQRNSKVVGFDLAAAVKGQQVPAPQPAPRPNPRSTIGRSTAAETT